VSKHWRDTWKTTAIRTLLSIFIAISEHRSFCINSHAETWKSCMWNVNKLCQLQKKNNTNNKQTICYSRQLQCGFRRNQLCRRRHYRWQWDGRQWCRMSQHWTWLHTARTTYINPPLSENNSSSSSSSKVTATRGKKMFSKHKLQADRQNAWKMSFFCPWWPWPSNSSKRDIKHVFCVHLAQIRSAVPKIFHSQTKSYCQKQNLMQFTACGNNNTNFRQVCW